MKLLIHSYYVPDLTFFIFNGYTIEVERWISISSHTQMGMWLLIHAGI